MTPSNHTFGPTCHLSHVVSFSGSKEDDNPPPAKAQFFYSSPLPIDDPLIAIPATTGGESKTVKHNPRPFSGYDNNALEEAWLGLTSEKDKNRRKPMKSTLKSLTESQAKRLALAISELATKHNKKHEKEAFFGNSTSANQKMLKAEGAIPGISGSGEQNLKYSDTTQHTGEALRNINNRHVEDSHQALPDSVVLGCCTELEHDVKTEARKIFGSNFKKRDIKSDQDKLLQEVMEEAQKQKNDKASSRISAKKPNFGSAQADATDDIFSGDAAHDLSDCENANHDAYTNATVVQSNALHAKTQSFTVIPGADNRLKETSQNEHDGNEDRTLGKHNHSVEVIGDSATNLLLVPGNPETGTTGLPFVRAPTRETDPGPSSRPATPSQVNHGDIGDESDVEGHSGKLPVAGHGPQGDSFGVHHKCKAYKNTKAVADVPVGISRLHLVKLPILQMMPIYWSPVHDIAAVTRATWFYKDTMYPVEAAVANQLELGYRELRPWSQTWSDELNSAVEVGAAGEEKISHRLWPKETDQKVSGTRDHERDFMPTDPICAARCFGGNVSATGTVDPSHPDEKIPEITVAPKRFLNSHVIYKDSQNAFILKPSLQPSEYYGRRPAAKIKRGTTVGLHVIRGFNWKAWEKLHPTKKTLTARKAEAVIPVAGNADATQRTACPACWEQEERPRVTDLVLVIHGIGQKLSERVESFHFTHAINTFRRSVNIELGNEAVQKVLREDLGGVMVLPVNWRSNLSFDPKVSEFSLKDITPETIPAVRSVISEVVMDVPYYMSSHRAAMNEALVTEANRVYRIWCRNNPDFHKNGRVHVIAHSLGSAMAMDVLSKQPTCLGKFDPQSKRIPTKHFEFDTKNLFFAGSPAGLFLLLDKSQLVPRKGRNKPGTDDADDNGKGLTGEVGTFGCLAVDNLYNIIHQNDPIACRLNATVDAVFASSLKNAHIPSATTGWLGAISNAVRALTPGAAPAAPDLGIGQVAKPSVVRLPSQLEMEVHDFTREEIAEKKFYLLNDNGQIDYFLSSGGGPLEIQYLNMLSAHSSYWISPDFVRMLVIEIGRKPGRYNCLPNMKVVKKTAQK